MMLALRIKVSVIVGIDGRIETNFAFHAGGKWYGYFINANDEAIILPCHARGTDIERRWRALQAFFAAFGHGPAMARFAIKTDIDGAKIFWIGHTAATGKGVVGREDAAYKSDNRKTMFFIIA